MAAVLRPLRYLQTLGGYTGHVAFTQRKIFVNSLICYDNAAVDVLYRNVSINLPVKTHRSKRNAERYIKDKVYKIELGVQRYGRVRKHTVLSVLKMIEESDDIDSFQALVLLRSCGNAMVDCLPSDRIKIVNQLLDVLNKYNIPINISHYNALLQVHLENNNEFSPTQFLSHMSAKGVEPNYYTYLKLLEYYCRKGNIVDATKVLECMEENEIPITEATFSSLIIGYSQVDDMESALKSLDIMKRKGIKPSIETYTNLMCAYAKRNDIEKIREIMSTCKLECIFVSNKNILDVIYTLVVNNHMEHVDEMLKQMRRTSGHTDEIHCALKLIHINQIDLAVKILFDVLSRIKDDKMYMQTVQLFFQTVVHSNIESDDVIRILLCLNEKTNVKNIVLTGIYHSFFKDDEKLSLTLLDAYKQMNHVLQPHYFWPLLVKKGKKHDFQGILDLLELMITKYKTMPCIDTLKDFVIPYSFGNTFALRRILRGYQIPYLVIDNAFVYSYLLSNKPRKAAQYMQQFRTPFMYTVLQKVLIKAVSRVKDIDSFIFISQQLCEKIQVHSGGNHESIVQIPMEKQLLDFIDNFPAYKSLLSEIIVKLSNTEVRISLQNVNVIRDYLKEYDTSDVEKALKWLTVKTSDKPVRLFRFHELLNLIQKERSANFPVHMLENQLIQLLLEEKRTSPSNYITATSYFCKVGNVKLAGKCMEKFKDVVPPRYRAISRIHLEYANLLLRNNDINGAIQHLIQNPASRVSMSLHVYSESMLQDVCAVAKDITASKLEELFCALKDNKYIKGTVGNSLLLINAYIQEDNYGKAVDFFCSTNDEMVLRKIKHYLIKVLIGADKHDLLQKVIDHCSTIQTKTDVLIDLFFEFLDCGREKQAMKIFQMYEVCENTDALQLGLARYVNRGNKDILEKYLDVTQQSLWINRNIDRRTPYQYLIQIHVSQNDYKSALNVWRRMQEEDITPEQSVLCTLAKLLKYNDQEVPFEREVANTGTIIEQGEKTEEKMKKAGDFEGVNGA